MRKGIFLPRVLAVIVILGLIASEAWASSPRTTTFAEEKIQPAHNVKIIVESQSDHSTCKHFSKFKVVLRYMKAKPYQMDTECEITVNENQMGTSGFTGMIPCTGPNNHQFFSNKTSHSFHVTVFIQNPLYSQGFTKHELTPHNSQSDAPPSAIRINEQCYVSTE